PRLRPSPSSRKWNAPRAGALSRHRAQARSPQRLSSRMTGGNGMNVATILNQKGGGVFTATSEKSLLDIAKLLAQHGIGCIVILGDDDNILGIVSERDLMRAISQGGPEVLKAPVSDFMTTTVITAGKDDTMDQLMSEMTIHRFRHMPVVERGRWSALSPSATWSQSTSRMPSLSRTRCG